MSKLKYDENPDYNKLRSIFRGGISGKDEWKLDLPLSIASSTSQVALKRKSVEPSSPVEKKVSKKNSTPKPKNIKKTAKQMKSPVKTPVKSPVPTGSKVVTPKVPGRQKTLAARKRSRSRSPADALSSKKNDTEASKKTTKRRVKRRKAVSTTDASIQTSPGFASASK